MSEADNHTPTPEPAPSPNGSTAAPQLPGLLVAITAVAWIAAGAVAFMKWNDFDEGRSDWDISAPQVSQLADEYLAAVLPWTIGAFGVTAICVVAALARLINLAHRATG